MDWMISMCWPWLKDCRSTVLRLPMGPPWKYLSCYCREQYLPPKNVSLWQEDLFRLNTFKKAWLRKFLSCSLLRNCLKEFRERACSQNRAVTRNTRQEYGPGVVGETRPHSLPPRLCRPNKHAFARHLLFHLHELLFFPWGPKPLPPNTLLCLLQKMDVRWRLQPGWKVARFVGSLSYTHVNKLLFDFHLLICFMSI